VSLSYKNKPPRGAKIIPATKSVGKTVLGVNNGCQALRRCCLKAVSTNVFSLFPSSFPSFV
jgi:phosphoribosylformylglycinamidine (FGAM) synthase-like amidotransferase family enzyme